MCRARTAHSYTVVALILAHHVLHALKPVMSFPTAISATAEVSGYGFIN